MPNLLQNDLKFHRFLILFLKEGTKFFLDYLTMLWHTAREEGEVGENKRRASF